MGHRMNVTKFTVKPAYDERGNRTGQWYVVEVAGNGEPVNVTQMYTLKSSAVRAARRKASRTPSYLPWEIVVED